MLKIMAFLNKRQDLETRAFIEHYEKNHVPLVCSLAPPPIVYRRNYLVRDVPPRPTVKAEERRRDLEAAARRRHEQEARADTRTLWRRRCGEWRATGASRGRCAGPACATTCGASRDHSARNGTDGATISARAPAICFCAAPRG